MTALLLLCFTYAPAHAQCASPAGSEGDVVFNSSHNVPQYCDGSNNWIAMVGADSRASLGCSNIGDSCNDGSLFAGDTNLYVTNVNQNTNTQWNASVGNNDINPDSTSDGQANHDNATVALSNLLAINICETLDLHGHQDWYLPARDELDQLYQNKAAIDTNAAEAFTAFDYWSSSEVTTLDVWIQRFSDGFQDNAFGKDNYGDVRCVRRDTSSQITQIVPSGLVAHWRLDETSGADVIDYASANNGTMVDMDGAANGTTGVVGGALDFNNSSDVIDIPTFNLSGPAATFSAWVYMRSLPGDSRIITKADSTASDSHDWAVFIEENGGFLKARIKTTGTTQESDTDGFFVMPTNKWTHVTFVYDSAQTNEFAWYVNGQLVNTENHVDGGNIATSTKPVALGNKSSLHGGGSRELDGKLDDVRVYNRALTADEIQEIYEARDGVRYNQSFRTPEFFDGNKWVSMRRGFREVDEGAIYQYTPASCSNAGDLCADGTIFAGDTNLFVTDVNQSTSTSWGSGINGVNAIDPDSETDGQANHDNIAVALNLLPAIELCENLDRHGYQDWYLPAKDELYLLYTNKNAINASANENFQNIADYWSSSEDAAHAAYRIWFDDGTETWDGNTNYGAYIRCVRRGSASVAGMGGLIGHWRLDETEGSTIVDSTGNNNGSISGQYTLQASGAVGGSIDFRSASVIEVLNPSEIIDLDQASFSLWFKVGIDMNQNQFLFDKNGDYSLWVDTGTDNIGFTWDLWSTTGVWETANSSIPSYDRWHHLVVTYDGTDVSNSPSFYLNGGLLGTNVITAPVGPIGTSGVTRLNLANQNNSALPLYGKLDDVRIYDRILSNSEIQTLYNMGAPVGSSTALPQGCPNIGDVCDDGTVYAGLSPDGNVAMYVSSVSVEAELPWNNGNSSNSVLTNLSSTTDGDGNTTTLALTDSDSGTAGFQPHQAAQYCFDLNAHGANDWYLPSSDEINLIWNGGNVLVDDIDTSGVNYWTSRENNQTNARTITFNDGAFVGQGKWVSRNTRCVRKGPAPRCANPYGREGDMFYNTTHDVVQYCDGARWIAVGKDN